MHLPEGQEEEVLNTFADWEREHIVSAHLKVLEVKKVDLILELHRLKPGTKTLTFVFKMLMYLDDIDQASSSNTNRPFDETLLVIDGIIEYLNNLDAIDQSLRINGIDAQESSNFPIKVDILQL